MPVPAVRSSDGPRAMVVVSVAMALMGLGFLGLTFLAAATLAQMVGLADTSTAVVTEKTYKEVTAPRRGGCNFYRFEVAWADREGHFTVCDNPDFALIRLEVGDEVVISSVPWSSEVHAEGQEGARFWAVVGLLAGVGLLGLGIAWVLRYQRLVRGSATGVRLWGQATKCTRNSVTVRLETPGLEGRRLVLLPAKRSVPIGEGDRVEVWASRRSVLTRRPRGPWVARVYRSCVVFTHARLRGPE